MLVVISKNINKMLRNKVSSNDHTQYLTSKNFSSTMKTVSKFTISMLFGNSVDKTNNNLIMRSIFPRCSDD